MDKEQLLAELAAKLRISEYRDYSNNGLQIDCTRRDIRKICTGVDASLPFFRAAAEAGADMIICHHGISWGDSLKYITGLNYTQIRFLIEHDIALWVCHIPLDAHAELGNNAGLCDVLGLADRKPFGVYHGQAIGFSGTLPAPLSRNAFGDLVRAKINPDIKVIPFGKEEIRTVGVVSGAGGSSVSEAIDAGLDAFVTGEADLVAYNTCQQREMNFFAAGHYATEKFGVRALGEWLATSFGLEHGFIDFNTPY